MQEHGKYSFLLPWIDEKKKDTTEFIEQYAGESPVIHTPQVTPDMKKGVLNWVDNWMNSVLKRDFNKDEINFHLWRGAQIRRKITKQPLLPEFKPRGKVPLRTNPKNLPQSQLPRQIVASNINPMNFNHQSNMPALARPLVSQIPENNKNSIFDLPQITQRAVPTNNTSPVLPPINIVINNNESDPSREKRELVPQYRYI